MTGRVPSKFEIQACQYDKKKDKLENRSYRDHSDNYITLTGHLIKDHAIVRKTLGKSTGRCSAAEVIEQQNNERNQLKKLMMKQQSRPISRQEILN